MTSVSGIRIDSLLHSLKELQNEKQCLELKLNDRKSRAHALERRVDHCNTKLTQVKEMYQKLTEMQKVAVQKVQQTQQQMDGLHQLNQVHSNKIKDLNKVIQHGKDKGLKNVEGFQDKMSALSDKLIKARKFYKPDALQKRIEEICDRIQQNESSVKSDSEEVTCIVNTMDSLQLTPPEQSLVHQVSHQTRLAIWSMLAGEEDSVRASLQRLQAEQQEICTLLQESYSFHSAAAKQDVQ